MKQIGKYERLELLGRGGCGEVWKARDAELGRIVALKLMQRTDAEDLARFKREAHVVARLSHPNIAQLYEFSVDPPYLAMQYIEGGPISEAKEKIAALRDAARAVQFAHERGILHRDLKPANIMVDVNGRASVLDFGLAREVKSDQAAMTLSGEILGTPCYMSPEQARGDVHALDARTDVYGLGATLYHLIAGRPPHAGPTAFDVVRKVLDEDPLPSGGDRDLALIALKALDKDPARRYQTANEFADDLDRYLNKEPIVARPASTFYRLKKRIQRQPVIWSLSTLLVVAILGGTGFGAGMLVRRMKDKDRAAAKDRVEKLLADATELVYMGDATPDQLHARAADVVREVNRVLPDDPDDSLLFLYRGRARRLLGEDAAAEADFLKAVALDPDEGSAHYELGWMYLEHILDSTLASSDDERERQMDEAKKEWLPRVTERFDLAIRSRTSAQQVRLLVRLWGLHLDGKNDEARRECDAMIAKGGRVEEYYQLRGSLPGTWGPRLRDFEEAVQRAPNNARYRFGCGWLKDRLGEYEGAIEDSSRAIELKKGFASAYYNRGVAKYGLGDYRGSIEDGSRAIELKKDYWAAYNNRGSAKTNLGDDKGAIEDYSRAIDLKKDYAEAYFNRANAKLSLGDPRDAIEDCSRAIELKKAFPEAYVTRGRAKGELGDREGEIEDCSRAIGMKNDYALAYRNRGAAKVNLRDWQGAIEDYSRAINLKKDEAEAYANRGWAREAMAKTDEAHRREFLNAAADDFEAALKFAGEKWPHRTEVEAALKRVRAALEKLGTDF